MKVDFENIMGIDYEKCADLVRRLNEYSAARQHHGGITAEAADAIEKLCDTIKEWEKYTGFLYAHGILKEEPTIPMACRACYNHPSNEVRCDAKD